MKLERLEMKKLELEVEKTTLEIKHLGSRWEKWVVRSIPILTAGIAVVGFWVSVHQFNVQQREAQTWKKAEFITATVREFDSRPCVLNVESMLDSLILYKDGRAIRLFPNEQAPTNQYATVTADDISNALDIDREKYLQAPETTRRKWRAIADCFDVFLSHLDRFNSYIESRLITKNEIELDLIYWVQLIGDDHMELVYGPDVRPKLLTYADHYKFYGVGRLLKKYGYKP